MGHDLTLHLMLLGLGTWSVCVYLASREVSLLTSILLATIRVGIPVFYFGWYFNEEWLLTDDIRYFSEAQYLLDTGGKPWHFLTPDGFTQLESLRGGRHVFYSWWNLVLIWTFGVYYYAPVLMNVIVTFLSAKLLLRLAAECGFGERIQKPLYIFLLLHPDTITWSSLVSLKDNFVVMMTLGMFLTGIRAVRYRSRRQLLYCIGFALWFQTLRFYIPFLIAGVSGVWLFLEWENSKKYFALAAMFLVAYSLAPPMKKLLELIEPSGLAYGGVRFLLTPIPWEIEGYKFLLPSAIFHWMMFLPAIAGAVMLWRESKLARLVLLYGLTIIAFYAVVDDLQGVRHRYQISFVFIWAQFHFIYRWNHAPNWEPSLEPSSPSVLSSRLPRTQS